jgi:hypothetical protein
MKTFYFHVLCCILFLHFFQANAQGQNNTSPSSKATYSNKLLNNTYAGFCYRVRRASDNAEAWIDFDATTQSVTANSNAIIVLPGSSNLVPGTVMSFSKFYAAANCYVTTWFDQSGNGYDALQANNTAQPRIVNAGVIDELQYTDSKFTHSNAVTLSTDHSNADSRSLKNKGR